MSIISAGNTIKDGDWQCRCGFINFAVNLTCKDCNQHKITGTIIRLHDGFSKSPQVNVAQALKLHKEIIPLKPSEPLFKDGDWICKKCFTHNFARRKLCFKCNR